MTDAAAAVVGRTAVAAGPGLDALWLAALGELTGRVAHEVRNRLNGTAVNLEVVRSRAGRPGAPASALAPFAEAASEQLEHVIAVTEALFALARPPRSPADVRQAVDAIRPMLAEAGYPTEVEPGCADAGAAGTGAAPGAVRYAVAAPLIDLLSAGRRARVVVACGQAGRGPELRVTPLDAGGPLRLTTDALAALAAAGVRARPDGPALTLAFPALTAPAADTP